MTYEAFDPLKVVFQIGDQANRLLIILSGEAFQLIPLHQSLFGAISDHIDPEKLQNFEIFSKKFLESLESLPESIIENLISRILPLNQNIQIKSNYLKLESFENGHFSELQLEMLYALHIFPKLAIMNILSEGDQFGEQSLLDDSDKRQSTIFSRTKLETAILNRDAFNRTLYNAMKKHQNNICRFLNDLPIFQSLDLWTIRKILNFTKLVKIQINDIIFKKGQLLDFIYVIQEGTISVVNRGQVQSYINKGTLKQLGQIIGENSIYQQKSEYDFICKESGELLQINIQSLMESVLANRDKIKIKNDVQSFYNQRKKMREILKKKAQKIHQYDTIQNQNQSEHLDNQYDLVCYLENNQNQQQNYINILHKLTYLQKKKQKFETNFVPFGDYIDKKADVSRHFNLMTKQLLDSRQPQNFKKPGMPLQRSVSPQHRILSTTNYYQSCEYFQYQNTQNTRTVSANPMNKLNQSLSSYKFKKEGFFLRKNLQPQQKQKLQLLKKQKKDWTSLNLIIQSSKQDSQI